MRKSVVTMGMVMAAGLVAPLFWLATRHFSGEIKRASREKRSRSGAVSAVAEESLGNAAIVQAYTREGSEVARLTHEGEAVVAAIAAMAATAMRRFMGLAPLVR